MKLKEYKTTSEIYNYYSPADFPNPSVPHGDGWEMCGSVITDTRLIWFWVREVEDDSSYNLG